MIFPPPSMRIRKWHRALRSLFMSVLIAALAAVATIVYPSEFNSTRVITLKNREYAAALLNGIRGARSQIMLCSYIFKTTGSPTNLSLGIANELIRAHQRGVDVTVILERSEDAEDSLNRENNETGRILSRQGVSVRFDAIRKTTHSKVVVIDGRYVYLGSHNLTQSALTRNNEFSVLIDSPEMAREVLSYLGRL
jgi:phosphatidylserine/phosphatidylglycerophosphate/cardiolipin synthase-like enzyme